MEWELDGRSPAARLAVVCVVSTVLGRLGALDPTGERCSSRKMPGNRVSAPELRWGWEEARLHLYSGVLIHPREGGGRRHTVPKEMVSSSLNPLFRFHK